MANKAFALVVLIFVTVSVFAQDELETARSSVRDGKLDAASSSYLSWLRDHSNDEKYASVAVEAAPYISDLAEKRNILLSALVAAQQPETRHSILVSLAETEEQLGALSEAQKHYRDASFALPSRKDFVSLLSSALLCFELGEYQNAEAQARVIVETGKDPSIISRASILLSRLYFVTDRSERAFSLLLDGGNIRSELNAEGVYWLARMAMLSGDKELGARAKEKLLEDFSDSLEAGILRDEAGRLPSASAILEALPEGKFEEDTSRVAESDAKNVGHDSLPRTEPEASTVVEAPTVVSIQTGSFTVRENAEYAAADLKAEGFDAAIFERTINGIRYYRVVVPDIPRESLARMVLELKEAGFEGFPIYE